MGKQVELVVGRGTKMSIKVIFIILSVLIVATFSKPIPQFQGTGVPLGITPKETTGTSGVSSTSTGGGDKKGLTWAGAKKQRCKVPFRDPKTGRTRYVYTSC